jgi:hypothetical protein
MSAVEAATPTCPTVANQSGKNLNKADLHGCDLAGFSFSGANLNQSTFTGANLAGATFAGANVNQADFTNANLVGVSFAGANMNKVALDHSDFTRGNVNGANTNQVTCVGTILVGLTGSLSCMGAATAPGAPTSVVGTPGNAQVSVAFGAPATNGGTAITSYTVTSSPGGKTAIGATSPLVVTGLTNGTPYTFTMAATNGVGAGPASTPSSAVTPFGPPAAPTGVVATDGNAQVSVAFSAPASNGGRPISSYTVSSSPGG